jgi:periplasmic protein TonB
MASRDRTWSPGVILAVIGLHAVVLYLIAITFQIVPSPIEPTEPPATKVIKYNPPKKPDEPKPKPDKKVPPRIPKDIRTDTPVEPIPTTPKEPEGPTTDVTGPVSVDGEINEQPIEKPSPRYPQSQIERGVEGRVVLSITIMPDGTVRDVRVVTSKPPGAFDAAAIRAVQRWRYRPSNVIRTNVLVDIEFQLTG